MKCNHVVGWAGITASLAVFLLMGSSPARAGTVAYWRFEEGPVDTNVQHLSGVDGTWSADLQDSSGNGNSLSVWSTGGGAGFVYRSDVPAAVIPQTGAADTLSVKNTGGGPAMWCTSLRTWAPAAFTIEATFKPENGGWRTIVGRDSRAAGTQGGADPNASALYFQIQPDNRVAITFEDVGGYSYTATSAPGLIQGFNFGTDPNGLTGRWYTMAGVSDGTKLSLYLNDIAAGTGYQLVAQSLLNKGSTNTAMSTGLGSAGDWTAGDFSVGRGLYNGGHGDRAYGFIDEVRLSDTALAPNAFLFAAPSQTEVRGTVTNSFNGQPVSGASVTLGPANTITDTSGKYSLFNTPGSSFPITITAPYAETSYSANVTFPAAGFITKDAALPIRPHLTLDTASGFSWKALLNTGDTADYSAIVADETAFKAYVVPSNWDAIDATDDIYGWIRVHFTLPAGFTTTLPGRAVRLRIAGGIDDVDKTYLNGTLIGAGGKFPDPPLPIQTAGHINPPAGQTYAISYPGVDLAWTSERIYSFPASLLTPGDNVIAIKCFDLTGGGGVAGSVTLEVAPGTGAVAGTLKAGGTPIANARVAVSDSNGLSSAWGWTDATGAFALPYANSGAGVLGVTRLGFNAIVKPVNVPVNGTLTLNLTTTAAPSGADAPIYDNFDDNAGVPTWQDKWWPVALEDNSDPLNTPTVTQPGYDISQGPFYSIPSTVTVSQLANGHRNSIVSKGRFSKYASVSEAKLVSAKGPAAGSTDPWSWNSIINLHGNAAVDPSVPTPGIFNPEVEMDIEGWRNDGTADRVQWIVWDTNGRRSNGVVPFSLAQMADVTVSNPLILAIARTGSVYDYYINGTLVHSEYDGISMPDHRIALYGYDLLAENTWDWVAAGPLSVTTPVKGDVSGNGLLDFADVVSALRIAGGLSTSTSAQVTAGNQAGGDSIISVLDAVRIDQALNGKAL